MLRRLETMILMAGYEMPLKTIREQIASAVDLIVHTARLGDGSRKVVNITEVFGIEDDQILTQDIFAFRQTGVNAAGKIEGDLHPTGKRPTFMPKFAASGIELPPDEYGIPPEDPSRPTQQRVGKGRSIGVDGGASPKLTFGLGRTVIAGGMAYISSVGPVVPETGRLVGDALKAQARQALENLKARLEEAGSSLDHIALANWSLKDPADFETFNEEWVRWFPGDGPVGQLTLMPPQHRRAGFRISLGAIAETDGSRASGPMPSPLFAGQVLVTEPPMRLLPSGVEEDRRKGQRRRALPAGAAAELVPKDGERRRAERRKRDS
jgi:enamine deaminase RidA (YjgF/YER057c/UK114 family)